MYRISQESRNLHLQKHQPKADEYGDNTRMRAYLFNQRPPIRRLRKIRHSQRPHRSSLRNQVKRGVEKPHRAEDALRHRISQNPGIGRHRRVFEDLLLFLSHTRIQYHI